MEKKNINFSSQISHCSKITVIIPPLFFLFFHCETCNSLNEQRESSKSALSFHSDPNLFLKIDYRHDSLVPILCLCSINGLLNNTQLLCLSVDGISFFFFFSFFANGRRWLCSSIFLHLTGHPVLSSPSEARNGRTSQRCGVVSAETFPPYP